MYFYSTSFSFVKLNLLIKINSVSLYSWKLYDIEINVKSMNVELQCLASFEIQQTLDIFTMSFQC